MQYGSMLWHFGSNPINKIRGVAAFNDKCLTSITLLSVTKTFAAVWNFLLDPVVICPCYIWLYFDWRLALNPKCFIFRSFAWKPLLSFKFKNHNIVDVSMITGWAGWEQNGKTGVLSGNISIGCPFKYKRRLCSAVPNC